MGLHKNKPFGSVAFFFASSIRFNCFSFASFSSLASFSALYLAAEDEKKERWVEYRREKERKEEEEKDKEEEEKEVEKDDNNKGKKQARGREGGEAG